MKQRIQKVLAAAGVDSRRHIEEMVLQGRVAVNGKTMTRLPILVDPDDDEITVDGEDIKTRGVLRREEPGEGKGRGKRAPQISGGAGRFYLMLNKPRGVYSTNLAQGAQTRAIDLLPPNFPARVYPVGRLDADSRGLLLLTNDGELTNLLTHPRFGVPKTYRATVDAFIPPEHMTLLEKGLYLIDHESGRGTKTGRAVLKIHSRTRSRTVLDITIKEGKNRQIRRMLARLGHKVRDLYRIKFGPLTLESLPMGAVRQLTPAEVKLLREAAERSKKFFEKSAEESPTTTKGRRPPTSPTKGPASAKRPPKAEKPPTPTNDHLDFVPDDTDALDDD